MSALNSSVAIKKQNSLTLLRKRPAEFMLLALLCLGMLSQALNAQATENLYEKNYQAQNNSNLKSLESSPDTKMYVSNHKDEDNISMLENGYDMMGASAFDATDTPAEQALQFGKIIKADTVLVYSKYGSEKTSASKLQLIREAAKRGGEIDAKDLEKPATEYQYYASYWAKLPPPLLGVHIIKLKKRANATDKDAGATEEKGLKVIAVIKDSPAAKAGVSKGDVLLKIGEMELQTPDDLFAAVKRYAGQSVPVELLHEQDAKQLTVALNSRR